MKNQLTIIQMLKSCLYRTMIASLLLSTAMEVQAQQDKTGRDFITALLEQNYTNAWNLLDQQTQKTTSLDALQEAAKSIQALTPQFGKEVALFMRGTRNYQDGSSVLVYSYKFRGDVTKGIPLVLIDVAYKDAQGTAIVGFLPKFSPRPAPSTVQISTTSGREESLEKEQEWMIGGAKFQINELSLIVDDSIAFLAIKVMDDYPATITQPQAKERALPFVHYALENGYVPKAELAAIKLNRKLSDQIGVAFIRPGTRGGYRVLVAPSDYKR